MRGLTATEKTNGLAVGEGLAPPAFLSSIAVGEGLAPPEITVKSKPCGEVVKEQLQLIETRFPSVTIEDYVIMPDHIHAVIFLHEKAGGASPSPTLDDVGREDAFPHPRVPASRRRQYKK